MVSRRGAWEPGAWKVKIRIYFAFIHGWPANGIFPEGFRLRHRLSLRHSAPGVGDSLNCPFDVEETLQRLYQPAERLTL